MSTGVRAWVLLVVVLAAVGVVLLADLVAPVGMLAPLPLVIGAGILVGESFPVWQVGRPRRVHVTISELFVGVALVALDPGTALAACIAGSVANPLLRVRTNPVTAEPERRRLVLLHGTALPVLRSVVAVAVLVAATDRGVAVVVGAALGMLAFLLVDAAATAAVISLDARMSLRDALPDDVVPHFVVPAVAGAFGIGMGTVVVGDGTAWLQVLGMVAATMAVSRLGVTLGWEQERSRVILGVASGGAVSRAGVEGALARDLADALHVQRVEVVAEHPRWADLTAPLGRHGWLGVAEPRVESQGLHDARDQRLLDEIAAVATVVLDRAALLDSLAAEEAARSTLLAAAAHDMRSPLAIVQTGLQTIREHDERLPPELRRTLVDRSVRAVERANRLVHDLLVLEREHLAEPDDAPVADVGDVVTAVVAALPREAGRRCRLDLPATLPLAAMSPVLLERVLDNLVANALRHTAEDEDIDVRVRAGDRRVVISVEDRGPGVPEGQRGHILAPFAGVEGAATTSGGFGLGLHIVSEFVRWADGELSVGDRADGSGAVFRVSLPSA